MRTLFAYDSDAIDWSAALDGTIVRDLERKREIERQRLGGTARARDAHTAAILSIKIHNIHINIITKFECKSRFLA